MRAGAEGAPTVAILPWGQVIEDFLEPEGLSIDEFAEDYRGSWMFGYADALATAGIRTVLIVVSATAAEPAHRIHRPTGALLSILPAPAAFRAVRRRARNLYARDASEAFGRGPELGVPGRVIRVLAHTTAPYGATPLRPLARELRALNVAALVSQEYESPQFDVAVAAAALARVPIAATFQGGDYQRYPIERVVRPFTIGRAACLIVPTTSEAARVGRRYGVPPEKIARIFNPVDTATWRPREAAGVRASLGIEEGAPLVAWHGRVAVAQKGLDVLLQAWRLVEGRWEGEPRPALLLVGGGRDSETVDRLARELGLRGVARVPQHVHAPEELAELLSAADLYVLPSRHEGFPVALLEGLACGLPAVAADANGVADILDGEGAAGGVVVPREDPARLAGALEELLRDPARLVAMGGAARAAAESRFSTEAIGARLRDALLASPGRAAAPGRPA